MVKHGNVMKKSIFREIRQSLGRYLAILAIIALGAGFFTGLRVSKSAMLETANEYITETALFDYRLLSTLGFEQEDVESIAQVAGVSAAEGSIFADFISNGALGENVVLQAHSITEDVNRLTLTAGRLPEQADECVADAYLYTEDVIGQTITVQETTTDEIGDTFAYTTYTIVGLVNSPYYMNYERGTSTLGSGRVVSFVYMPREGFSVDYFTEILVTLQETGYIYSDEYEAAADAMEDPLTQAAEAAGTQRYDSLLAEANEEIASGRQEYEDGLAEYESERADAEAELADAYQTLTDSEAEIEENQTTLEGTEYSLFQSRKEIEDGYAQLESAQAQLNTQRESALQELESQETQLTESQQQAQEGAEQVVQGLSQVEDGISQIDAALQTIEESLAAIEGLGQTEQEQALLAQREALNQQRAELVAQQAALQQQQTQIQESLAQIEAGFAQLEEARNEAEALFAQSQAQIDSSRATLDSSLAQVNSGLNTVWSGMAELEDARQELQDGWADYEEASEEAETQFAEAEAELADAETELADAEEQLAELTPPNTYVLGRETNVGYVCFESDTDIVEGISGVFPLFFFLVAALVCITTMTRMVDEERTQIGTLKALGYGNGAIMTKYMVYSGSAALIGCVVGVALGSLAFPAVLWQAYSIMYNFSEDIIFVFDWPLSILTVVAFLVCSLGATWLSCRSELHNVAAELIRPKSPKAGKRVFLERIPFIWKHLSFLYKVSIRNIFRYKKRLFMMVVGIGGCTALLITGFGIRDSISNVANYQYDEITVYDCSVLFEDPMDGDAQAEFSQNYADVLQGVTFVEEGTVDLVGEDAVQSLYLIASEENLDGFIDLHSGDTHLEYPQAGEVILSNGTAEDFGLSVGDTVTLRNADMDTLTLTVSGICENFVYNYAYIHADTIREQWNREPEVQTAYLNVAEGMDIHEVAARIAGDDNVSSISATVDMRDRVDTMMESLDAIVWFITLCAAALAFIVLYNLTNININERIREIATIKVLGFYQGESASYVFREIMMLTGIGAVVGLGLGRLLHAFVMSQIQIDMITFDIRVAPLSYVFSIVLTMAFACFVDFVMYFKLNRINMAEALKAIE